MINFLPAQPPEVGILHSMVIAQEKTHLVEKYRLGISYGEQACQTLNYSMGFTWYAW